MKDQKRIVEDFCTGFLLVIKIVFLSFLLLLTLPHLISLAFDFTSGKEIISDTVTSVVGTMDNPDEKALAIMTWERQYFYNPFSYYDVNSTLQKIGIYEINGEYKMFVRPAPVSWVINSRMANCEEYARIFVSLMNEEGIKSSLIKAPGEDHVWAEYTYEGYRIAVDPSQNYIIGGHKKEFEKRMNVKFSYVESIDFLGNKMDVSDEYIERGNLTITVTDEGLPVSNAQVIIENPSFMETRSERYKKPLPVILKTTESNGKVFFKLGFQKYNVKVRVNNLYLIDAVYQKNTTIENNNENLLSFNLEKDEKNNELFITRYI